MGSAPVACVSLVSSLLLVVLVSPAGAVPGKLPAWHPRAYGEHGGGGGGGSEPSGGGVGEAPPAAAQACALHVYRHLSKTGGTTVRFLFDKQTALGSWEFPLV